VGRHPYPVGTEGGGRRRKGVYKQFFIPPLEKGEKGRPIFPNILPKKNREKERNEEKSLCIIGVRKREGDNSTFFNCDHPVGEKERK